MQIHPGKVNAYKFMKICFGTEFWGGFGKLSRFGCFWRLGCGRWLGNCEWFGDVLNILWRHFLCIYSSSLKFRVEQDFAACLDISVGLEN